MMTIRAEDIIGPNDEAKVAERNRKQLKWLLSGDPELIQRAKNMPPLFRFVGSEHIFPDGRIEIVSSENRLVN